MNKEHKLKNPLAKPAIYNYLQDRYLWIRIMGVLTPVTSHISVSLIQFSSIYSQKKTMFAEKVTDISYVVGFVLLDLQFYVYVLQIVVCPFVLFLLAIVLSVLLRYTDSDYPFGIVKLFLIGKITPNIHRHKQSSKPSW